MADDTRTENDSLIEVAQQALADAQALDEPGVTAVHGVVLPKDARHQLIDLESFLPAPRRTRARVALHTATSLAAYVNRHHDALQTTLYADQERSSIVAVLNDAASDAPGWGDHRAELTLSFTPEWALWAQHDGKLLSQLAFAQHIEEGLNEIVDPPSAEMLELALTFEANHGVAFKSQHRLQDGQRHLVWQEQTNAKAGQRGELTIPAEFTLRLAPYLGSGPQLLRARLRYRVNEGSLLMGYALVRPHDVLQAAFEEALEGVETETRLTAFRGTPPVRPA